jgi:hypothetical protein
MRASEIRIGDLIGSLEVVDTDRVMTTTGTRVLITTTDGGEFDYAATDNIAATPRH